MTEATEEETETLETLKENPMLAIRKLLGLSQTQLAHELGWKHRNHVIMIEKGRAPIKKQTALALECLVRRANDEMKKAIRLQKPAPFTPNFTQEGNAS